MKEKVLEYLKAQQGFVSGQDISEQLGVSRTAVWKYIGALKQEGYEIESVTRKGYRLLQSPEFITEKDIRSFLPENVWPGEIRYFASIDSTNEEAKRQAALGAKDGTLFVADNQTAGKGRRGRNWVSPKGEDIFFTMLFRPDLPAECASMITLVAALAAAAAAEKHSGESCQIKWPNDIVLHGKKICGILTEMGLEMSEISYVIVGVGVNINRKEFPEDISYMATSIRRETGQKVIRAAFLADFLIEYTKRYEQFLQSRSLAPFKEEYEERLVNIGREVKIIRKDEELIRTALGITERGELLAKTAEGDIEKIFTGEVSVRGFYGYV
ncbi:MAG: biotin--[acetyl-CoA-carboxylase] ligase [Clostridiales bacterium]|nr:biotin--[acetyl-CoA-carboxylase] ligase [Clostridiales bacterium]